MKTTGIFRLITLLILLLPGYIPAQENTWNSPEWFDTRRLVGDRYETLEPCSDQMAIVRRDGRFGMVNRGGAELLPLVYSHIYPAQGDVLIVQQDGKSGAFSPQGAWIVPVAFSEVKTFPLAGGAVACRRDSMFAIFDGRGEQVTPIQFRDVKDITPGRIVARTGKTAWGAWDTGGNMLIPERYDDLRALPGGFWEACRLGQCALLGADGEPRTPFCYSRVIGLPDGNYLASFSTAQNGSLYWFDASGKRLSDTPEYYHDVPTGQGWNLPSYPKGRILLPWQGEPAPLTGEFTIRKQPDIPESRSLLVETGWEGEETLGWQDRATGQRMEPKFLRVIFQNDRVFAADYDKTEVYDRHKRLLRTYPFSTELVAGARAWVFRNNSGTGLCDTAFRIILPAREITVTIEPWGGFIAWNGHSARVFDPSGKPIFTEPVDWATQDRQHGQRLLFSQNKKTGIADFSGKIILPPTYDRIEACYFDGNYVAIQNNRLGLLNYAGKIVLPFGYDQIASVSEGLVKVSKNGKAGLADSKTGRVVLPLVFDDMKISGATGIEALRNGSWSVYDFKGREYVSNLTGKVTRLTGCRLVCSSGKWGITDEQFRTIEPFVYDDLYFRDGVITALQGTAARRWLIRDDRLVPTLLEKVRYLGDWAASPYWGREAGGWGLFNRNDQPLVHAAYDQVTEVNYGGILAVLRKGQKAEVWTVELKTIAPFDADTLLDCQQSYIRYRLNGQTRLRNLHNGESIAINADAWQAYPLGELLAVRNGNRVQLLSPRLQPVFAGDLDDYPVLSEVYCGILTAVQNGRHGLLRMDGTIVLPFEYDRIGNTSESMYLPFYHLSKGAKRGFYHCQTQRLLPAIYDNWDFVDTTGFLLAGTEEAKALFSPDIKQLTDFNLTFAEPFGANFFLITKENRVSSLIDRQGKAVLPGELTQVIRQGDFLKAFRKDKAGLIGPNGRVIIDFQYDGIEELGPYTFRASTNQNDALFQQRLFDHQGREISRQFYRRIETLTDSSFFVWDAEERRGIIGLDGRIILPLDKADILCWRGLCAVTKAGKWGLITPDGAQLLPFEYDFIDAGDEGPLVLGKQGRYGYIDTGGRWLTTLQYDYADIYSMGRAAVRKNGKWGFLDLSGKELIPLRFDYAENFRYNTPETVVLLDGRYMLIDTSGLVTRAFPYEQPRAPEFFHRRLEYENKTGKGTVLKDFSGRILLEKPDLRFMRSRGGLIVYAKDSRDECTYPPYGLMNYAGAPVGQAVYTHVNPDHLGVCYMIPAIRDKRWGFLDGRGHEVVPFEYDRAWNVYEPFKNGDWEGGVHLAGKSWIVNRFGKWVREQ